MMALKTLHTLEFQWDHSPYENIKFISVTMLCTCTLTYLKMLLHGAGYIIHQVDGKSQIVRPPLLVHALLLATAIKHMHCKLLKAISESEQLTDIISHHTTKQL